MILEWELILDIDHQLNCVSIDNERLKTNEASEESSTNSLIGTTSASTSNVQYSNSIPNIPHSAIANEKFIVTIKSMNPYSSRWTIKARVTFKSDLIRWENAKGGGTLFSIDLLDNEGGEIKGTFFKESCDKFFKLIEVGNVYTFSGGVIKLVTNKKYSCINNSYEINFGEKSEIYPWA